MLQINAHFRYLYPLIIIILFLCLAAGAQAQFSIDYSSYMTSSDNLLNDSNHIYDLSNSNSVQINYYPISTLNLNTQPFSLYKTS